MTAAALPRRTPPPWLLGLCALPWGMYGAAVIVTLPQLLAANGVAEPRIATVTAIGVAPSFCSFLLAPILDLRFSRRTYAFVLAVVSAVCLFAGLAFVHDLPVLTALVFVGYWASALFNSAIGGWFAGLVRAEDESQLGAWFTIGTLAGLGVTAPLGALLIHRFPSGLGAGLLCLLMLAPLGLLALVPATAPGRSQARESFARLGRDLWTLVRQPRTLWTLLLFTLPAASFALTNILAGLGKDFHASEQFVGLASGIGGTAAGVIGSLAIAPFARRWPPRRIYLLVGAMGALFTLLLIVLPRTPAGFGLAMLGENTFQAAAFTAENAIIFSVIGKANPLAATQFALLYAATNLPITYMQAIDGHAFGHGGVAASLATDALCSLAACAVLALLSQLMRRSASRPAPTMGA